MNYISTRGGDIRYPSAMAIKLGIAPDGGLFIPESIPAVSLDQILTLAGKSYVERAVEILALFLTDFTREELRDYASAAYAEEKIWPGSGSAGPAQQV